MRPEAGEALSIDHERPALAGERDSMKRIVLLLLAVYCGLGLSLCAQSWRQATGVNGGPTVSFPATVAGNLNVIVASPGRYTTLSKLSATDSKGQAYKLDGSCSADTGNGYLCVFYVCSGVGGVTSATVNGTDGIAMVDFLEGVGASSSNCAGATATATGTSAPSQISLTPDQPTELAVVGFACAGDGSAVNGNVTYGNKLDFGGAPVATAVTSSTATLTAQTDAGSAQCVTTHSSHPSGWNATFAAFRTASSSSISCPASVPVPSIPGCTYNLSLGSQPVGSTGSAQALNVSIAAGTTVGSIGVLTTGTAGTDFANAPGSTCTASAYSSATSCQLNVSFAPLAAGVRMGAVVFYSGANNTGTVLAAAPVNGVGTAPQVSYGPGGAQTVLGSGLSGPAGVAVDGAGDVFIADASAGTVVKVAPGGTQTTIGSGFSKPVGVAVDGAGNVYVADFNAAAVYQVSPGGAQTKVGSGLIEPAGVAVDGAGDVFVSDAGVPAVYEITPGGTQTKAGSGFVQPAGLAVDAAGDVFVADPGLAAVYKVTPGGAQTAVGSGFSKPEGVTLDAAGNVYIVDAASGAVDEVGPGGAQSVVGSSGFVSPSGVAVDGAANLFVADSGNGRVVKIDRADAPQLTFAATAVNSTSADSPMTVRVQNIGNQALTLTGLAYPADFPEAGGDASACTATTSLIPAQQCDLPVDFTPLSAATLSENIQLTDNALNVPGATQSIAVSGTGTAGLLSQTIAFAPPPSPVVYGVSPIALSATGGASGNPVVFSVVSGPGSIAGAVLTITGAGTVVVAANQAGNATYAAAPQATKTVVVNPAPQAIAFTPPPSPVTYGVSPITLSASGGASGNAVVFSVLSGPGSISGATLTITGVGTVVVAANQAGNGNYAAAAQATQSVTVNAIVQTISFTPPASPIPYGSTSPSTPVFTLVQKCHPTSNTTNTCTFANNVTPGDLVIGGAVIDNTIASTGVKDGAGNVFTLTPGSPCTGGPVTSHAWLFYLLSSPGGTKTNTVLFSDTDADYVDEIWAYEFSVSGATPVFDTDAQGCASSSSSINPTATLSLAGSNELAYFISYLAGGKATGPASPWTLGTLTQLHNVDGYDPNASSSIAASVLPAGDGWGILYAMAIKGASTGSGAISLSATGGGSGNPVVFSVLSGPGSITGNMLTITGAGTVVVAANQAGSATYAAAPQVTQSIVVTPAPQTIAFTPPTSPVTFGVAPMTLHATGGASGNPVVFSVLSGPGSVAGSTLTLTGAGTVVVAANQAGNANYAAAAQVTQSVVVNPGALTPQAITFTAPASPVTFGVAPITLNATGGASGNPVVFSVLSGPGSIAGSLLTITGAGTVVVAANQAGNATYSAAPQVTGTVVVNQASQAITFSPPPSPVTYPVSPITLSATGGSSGNPVTFSMVSGPGSISGSTLSISGVGTVVVAANQAGNANYAAAAQVTQSVVVNQGSLTAQTIVFTAPPSPVTYGVAPIALSATGGGSGNPVIFSVLSGPGSIAGNSLTITGAGTVTVAANQAGNSTYAAAGQVTQSITVNKAAQTISFTAPSSPVTFGVSPIALSASGGGSGNAVTFSVLSGPGSVSGSSLTITGAGVVVVAANQAASANYAAAAQVTQSVTVNQAPQTIVFTPPTSPVTYGVSPIALSATGGGSGNPIVFSVLSGPGSVTGSTLTITGAGTVMVAANQAGNANYAAAVQVTQSIVVNSAGGQTTVTAGQVAYAGDGSDCNASSLSCTISTTTGVTKMSAAFTSGSIVTLVVDGEGTNVWPSVSSIACLGNGSCGTWVHISNGTVVQCGSGSSNCPGVTNGSTCQSDDLNSPGHHFFTDCYYLLVTGSGVTGVKVTFADSSGGSDVTNMDLFIQEFKCSSAPCPTPTVTGQATRVYPGDGSSNGCSSCTGPAMALSGTNNIVIQNSVFEEKCGSGTCSCANYKLQSWDNLAQNATAYGTAASSAPQGVWPQSSKAGGIFTAFALNVGTQ
jgi:sugar lactone lactonase YvrE